MRPHDAASDIQRRMLIRHGAEEPVAPLTEVNLLIEDLRDAKIGWQLELYSGTKHGFSTPKNPDEERANTQSQAAMARFFKEVFGS
jgi:dienelactone hydrolase